MARAKAKQRRVENGVSEPRAEVAVADGPVVGCLAGRAAVLSYIFQGFHKGSPFVVTLKSLKSGGHFTYRLRPLVLSRPDRTTTASLYMDLKTGPEEEHWTWVGLLSWTGARSSFFEAALEPAALAERAMRSPITLMAGARCGHFIGERLHEPGVRDDAPSMKGLAWLLGRLSAGLDPAPLAEVWHDGRCCVCRRALTRPDSVSIGVGPDCLEKLGAAAVLAFQATRGAA